MLQTQSSLSIDGSLGEGGGQVLRTSLALALITGRSFKLRNIRSSRPKPGLMPQHLKAVEAARDIGRANVEGDRLGSQSLMFEPTGLSCGNFQFDIGTAGSTSLVFQTILPPLSFAEANSCVTLIGGTHVPWSPCFHFLEMHWLRYMRMIGFDIRLELVTAGFYPRGGGRVSAAVRPNSHLSPLCLINRGAVRSIRGISAVANLDLSIAERQKRRAARRLHDVSKAIEIEILRFTSPSKGSLLLLLAEFENSQCCFYGLGALGKPAETVADEAVDELFGFLATDGAIDHYLSDQLVLPLALTSGKSEISTSKVTLHLTTNAEIVRMFLPASIEIEGAIGQPGLIRIQGVNSMNPERQNS
ncbi:MAG TPA: RNA 3'-terminal phosphate cyclase [Acidobacteriota bacterium]|nr:RNA 3'-terminal phosphate cyclase [Acidobacteriota bacterium]